MGNVFNDDAPSQAPTPTLVPNYLTSNFMRLTKNQLLHKNENRQESALAYIAKIDKEAIEQGDNLQIMEFPTDLEWLNSPPLKFSSNLRGKLVVLDFWTYCCVNCLHILPALAKLEEKYKDSPVVFIGVHSAKFDNEKLTSAIRNAILRYNISHPVVNDFRMEMWKHVGISAWPSLALVGPDGKLLYSGVGENQKELIDTLIEVALKYYLPEKFDRSPIPLTLEREKFTSPDLNFPARIVFDETHEQLYISDSNNNRIVVVQINFQQNPPSANFLYNIGSGKRGFLDGNFDDCTFNSLQGICYDPKNNKIYVADTENHAIREVDLTSKIVTTLVGTGEQVVDYKGGKKGTLQGLNSPWDLILVDDLLYIAMAGCHQIWTYDLNTQVAQNFCGCGSESSNNSEDLMKASWAQPSGLALGVNGSNKILYIADSESSKIRGINLTKNETITFAGGTKIADDLKAFGDVDGTGFSAKFQHPLALLFLEEPNPLNGDIVVADTYNHKIKILSSTTGTVHTWLGKGISERNKNANNIHAQFNHPEGLALSKKHNILFITDTNNHVIKVAELSSGKVDILTILNLDNNTTSITPEKLDEPLKRITGSDAKKITTKCISVPFNGNTESNELCFQIKVTPPQHINQLAPSKWQLILDNNVDPILKITAKKGEIHSDIFSIPYTLENTSLNFDTMSKILLETVLLTCDDESGLCNFVQLVVEVPFVVTKNGEKEIVQIDLST